MKLRILHKLFLAVSVTSALVIVMMAMMAQYNLGQGFQAYLHETEKARLPELSEPLLAYYRGTNSWRGLRGGGRELHGLIYSQQRSGQRSQRRPEPEFERRPGEGRRAISNDHRPPPPRNGDKRRPPPPREGDGNPLDQVQRLSLLDAEKQLVAGKSGPADFLYELKIDGSTVGWLGLMPPQISAPAELNFIARQQQAFIWIGIALLILATLVSVVLSRNLVKPINIVVAGMRDLGRGKYGADLPIQGGRELAELAESFNHLSRALSQHELSRRDWTADIAHELRTPVAVLRGEIEALRDGIRPLDILAMESLLEEILHLQRLVDDLHQLAMSDSGSLNYDMRSTDLGDLLTRMLQSMSRKLLSAGLELDFEVSTRASLVYGDPDRLGQLFYNLVENSCRYTDHPGRVEVRLERIGKQLRLRWQDSAPCPEQDKLVHLFERFYRPDAARARHLGGSGLGLAICQSIVLAHGGHISAAQSPLGGLLIQVDLPLKEA